jgi:hypothetical protein
MPHKSKENWKAKCTKVEEFDLRPYGNYWLKFHTKQGHLPHIIPVGELRIEHDAGMPLSEEQEDELVKYMLKNQTDVLTDGRTFYTRTNSGITPIWHKKLVEEYFRPELKINQQDV